MPAKPVSRKGNGMKWTLYHSILILVLIAAGCQKQGPVNLIDDAIPNPVVVSPISISPDGAFGTEDIDSTRLFPPVGSTSLGQLIVAGSSFDSKTEHHEGSLARAIFLDRSAPVIIDSQTLGYKTLNAGIVGGCADDRDVDAGELTGLLRERRSPERQEPGEVGLVRQRPPARLRVDHARRPPTRVPITSRSAAATYWASSGSWPSTQPVSTSS